MVESLIQIYGNIRPWSQYTMRTDTETRMITMSGHYIRTEQCQSFLNAKKGPEMQILPCPAPQPYETPEELIVRLLEGPPPGALADPEAVLAALRQSADRITQQCPFRNASGPQ